MKEPKVTDDVWSKLKCSPNDPNRLMALFCILTTQQIIQKSPK